MGFEFKPDPKVKAAPKKKAAPRDPVAELHFKVTVCSKPCLIGKDCDGPLQAAHVVAKSDLKKRKRTDLIWDPVNGVPLCYHHHRRHDNGTEKIARRHLPASCLAWASLHGLSPDLERRWPLTPTRKNPHDAVWAQKRGLCRLCCLVQGEQFKVDPAGSFTLNNVIAICPPCAELLPRDGGPHWDRLIPNLSPAEVKYGEAGLLLQAVEFPIAHAKGGQA